MTDEYEKQTIMQDRGPAIRFEGKLIASTEFETRGREPMAIRFEVWESRGGALIAVVLSEPAEREGYTSCKVAVVDAESSHVPVGDGRDTERWAANKLSERERMRFAVMDHFEWHDRARSMVGKQLKWKLVREVA